VAWDGVPYDVSAETHSRIAGMCEYRHRLYDAISGKSAGNRSRQDPLDGEYLTRTASRLGTASRIKDIVNSFVAHASVSIKKRGACRLFKNVDEVLSELDKCYRDLIWVGNQLAILADETIDLAHVRSDELFKLLPMPAITRPDNETLRTLWDARSHEIGQWIEDSRHSVVPA
jgi:hypothetical protein